MVGVQAHTRACLSQVIASVLRPGDPVPDIDRVMANGGWWDDTGSEPFSVLVLTPQRVEPSPLASIRIRVEGGKVIEVATESPALVEVMDYDTQGVPDHRLSVDSQGRRCVIESVPASSEIDQAAQAWPHLLGHFSGQPEPGFVVLTAQPVEDNATRFEAWAYRGHLDFDHARPLCFGSGPDPLSALHALEHYLGDSGTGVNDQEPLTP